MPKTAKKTSEKPASTRVNKSAWIRDQAASLSAKEVVDSAKAKGIKLSLAQVYTARSNAKRQGKLKGKAPGRPRVATGRRGRKPAAAIGGGGVKGAGAGGGNERDLRHQFVSLAVRIGTDEAQRLLDRLVDVQTPNSGPR
jgi:hypothetical protein